MPAFDAFAAPLASSFSTELRAAIESAPLSPLGEGSMHAALKPLLTGGIGDHLTGIGPSRQMEILSGLWLVAGDIYASHSISQDLPSAEGSFLHGIMHRREGDFGNAKYWFRRVGSHPVFEQIAHESNGHYSEPFEFVDECAEARGEAVAACERSQWVEWQALLGSLVS
ncbi:MAG: hypothetical protein AAFU85_15470 [Planctomycetota bacterium]